MTIFRGVLGTQSVAHEKGELMRKINGSSELHRFSYLWSVIYLFEYIGYASNYSTSLPQKIKKQIEPESESLMTL